MYGMHPEQLGMPKSKEVLNTDTHDGGNKPKKQMSQLEPASDETL